MEKVNYEKKFEKLYNGLKTLKEESDNQIGPANSSGEVVRRLGYRDSVKSMVSTFDDIFAKSILELTNSEYKKEYLDGMLDFHKTLSNLIEGVMTEE